MIPTALIAAATFCNPLPLENYPIGVSCRMPNGSKAGGLWVTDTTTQYRELADPSLLFENGVWYVYPSAGMCWKSADNGRTWQHVPIDAKVSYAPTVVKHRGRFWLLSSSPQVYVADRPEGPWTEFGRVELPQGKADGEEIAGLWDPMYFSDDDGRLYLYWGCTAKGGIWGCEMDPANPCKPVSGAKLLIRYDPANNPWERLDGNDPEICWIEGAWMVKVNGKYVLTYAAAGTCSSVYAMGAAIGTEPLGAFRRQKNNPFFQKTTGLVTGTGHGSIAKGSDGDYYVAYSLFVGRNHGFERMIGMDKVKFDERTGEVTVAQATERPLREDWTPTGWVELAYRSTPGAEAAIDGHLATCWTPAKLPATLEVAFPGRKAVRAVRTIWRDVGLDTFRGVKPGPIQYRIDYRDGDEWKTLVDASDNVRDLMIDYRETPVVWTRELRLVVLDAPKGITPAVTEFTPFGQAEKTF